MKGNNGGAPTRIQNLWKYVQQFLQFLQLPIDGNAKGLNVRVAG